MANLYVWFPNSAERMEFVERMLGLEPVLPQSKTKKARLEAAELEEERQLYLQSLDEGMTRSAWFRLGPKFYMGMIPDMYRSQTHPWLEFPVWEKGFRRIYTQKSYYHRPGFWLVLQFRPSKAGYAMRQWVLEQVPGERIGRAVPVPRKVELGWELDRGNRLLDRYDKDLDKGKVSGKLLKEVQILLEGVLAVDPSVFAAKRVYLWERLAWAWNDLGDLGRAVKCLRTQAKLQPNSSEAWLNMGAFYAEREMWGPALSAYMEGLNVEPGDEYISYNVAALLGDRGMMNIAVQYLDSAIRKNPRRTLNYKLKGDMLLEWGNYREAEQWYRQGLKFEGPGMVRAECHTGIAAASIELGQIEQARGSLEEALAVDPCNYIALIMLASLEAELGNYQISQDYAGRALDIVPSSAEACRIIARCKKELGDPASLWFDARARREERH